MKKYRFLLIAILLAAGILGGFFVCQNSNAAVDILALNMCVNGQCSTADWLQPINNNGTYWIINAATSTLISSPADLSSCVSADISFDYKRYYKYSTGTSDLIYLERSINGVDWSEIRMIQATSTNFFSSGVIALECVGKVQIRFRGGADADSSHGVGIRNVIINTRINIPPIAIATSSMSNAFVGDEIIFDGSGSTSTNPYDIIDWLWDFGDGSTSSAKIASYKYLAPDVYKVYLRVGDAGGFLATSSPLQISVGDKPTTTATTTATTTPAEAVFAPSDIVINEIFPAGTDEWLELYNNSSSTIDLSGWLLLDRFGSGWSTTTLSGEITAKGYFVIYSVAGKLNNSGDSLILRSPDGLTIDTADYGDFSSKDDQSWARLHDGADTDSASDFAMTIALTKASANVITAKVSGNSGGSGYVAPKAVIAIATTTVSTTSDKIATDYFGKILLSELVPNPVGSDDFEFIELYNTSTSTIDVAKFVLMDASGNKHIIKSSDASSTQISSGGYMALYRDKTGIALNNTGVESASLLASDLTELDSVEYVAEKTEGVSFSRSADGKWRWVKTPTPNAENTEDYLYDEDENGEIIEPAAKTAKLVGTVKKSSKTAATKSYIDATLEQLKEFSEGDLVRARGVVSVGPGILGSQYFYLAGSGVQVYCYKKDFPELAIGDYIEVYGELSLSSAGRRIKITDRSQIKLIEKQTAPVPHKISASEVSEEYEGYLAEVSGTILEISGKNLIIDSDGTEAKIYLNVKIDMKDLGAKAGDQLAAVGIIGKTASGYRLMPRDINDLKLTPGQVKGEYLSAGKAPAVPTNYYLYALIGFLAAVTGMLWYRLNRNTK